MPRRTPKQQTFATRRHSRQKLVRHTVYLLSCAGALLSACQNFLGIEEPHPRAPASAGTDTAGAGHGGAGGSGNIGPMNNLAGSSSGEAGVSGGATPQAGAGAGGSEKPDPEGGAGGTDDGGDGGDAGVTVLCTEDERRCGGTEAKVPEICAPNDRWVVNTDENGGEACPFSCIAGACTECKTGELDCNGKIPRSCVENKWQDGIVCGSFCLEGECITPPSCAAPLDCGDSESCCSSLEVPGGEFTRDFDGVFNSEDRFKAKLSPFLLDEYEVTVGRFRRFVAAFESTTFAPGDGKAPHIEDDTGWRKNYELPESAEALTALFDCPLSTWTADGTGDESLPINCVNFFVAYAFCIWDGGRLPTEAEWNFAAAGGDQQRVYPWSVPPGNDSIGENYVVYYATNPLAVGSKPDGAGRFGHADLAGNIAEWVLDYYVEEYPSTSCNDCLTASGTGLRSLRGGAFDSDELSVYVGARSYVDESARDYFSGFRCVRDRGVEVSD